MEALIFTKPPDIYRQAYIYSRVNIVALVAVHVLHVIFYFVIIATAVPHHNAQFPWLLPDQCQIPRLFQMGAVGGHPDAVTYVIQ